MVGSDAIQVVCDAGPIIHLDELHCLDLRADLGTVQVPEGVWQEISLEQLPQRSTLFIRPSLLSTVIRRVRAEFAFEE